MLVQEDIIEPEKEANNVLKKSHFIVNLYMALMMLGIIISIVHLMAVVVCIMVL